MAFACHTPSGKVVQLDDLPIEVIQDIATKAGVESWFDVYIQPCRFGMAAVALYKHCCTIAGDEIPDPVLPRKVLDAWEFVEKDDLPTQWEDGVPLEEGDQTTPSSSSSGD